jgi:hypothetical protein
VPSTTTDQATELLKERLADIDSERSQIERALAALSPNGSSPRRGRPKGSTAKRRGRGRAKRRDGGTRSAEAVELVRQNPDITASEIAKAMKIRPNYLYRVLADLVKEKRLVKKGRKYRVGAKAAPAKKA